MCMSIPIRGYVGHFTQLPQRSEGIRSPGTAVTAVVCYLAWALRDEPTSLQEQVLITTRPSLQVRKRQISKHLSYQTKPEMLFIVH